MTLKPPFPSQVGSVLFDALAVGAAEGADRSKGVLYENEHVTVAVDRSRERKSR